ncbi:S1C family serine protease [Shewanella chilikensis]|uniref:S1C family serine protease n=1 Tax=Shewanella chilikensis TaxID=558541 RepID=UPI00399A4BC8
MKKKHVIDKEAHYRIICIQLSSLKNRKDILLDAKELLKVDYDLLDKSFNNLPHTLKTGLEYEAVKEYQRKLWDIGLECKIEKEDSYKPRVKENNKNPNGYKNIKLITTLVITLTALIFSIFSFYINMSYEPSELYEKYSNNVVQIKGETSSGTGFIIDDTILTNYHVIENEYISKLKISIPSTTPIDPRNYQLIVADSEDDVAIFRLKINLKTQSIVLDDKDNLPQGEPITVIGNPAVGGETINNSISTGVLGAYHKIGEIKYYQLSASVNHGNSGGPIFNQKGHVIGMVTLKAIKEEGIAFALPSSVLHEHLSSISLAPKEKALIINSKHYANVTAKRVLVVIQQYSNLYSSMLNAVAGADNALSQIINLKTAAGIIKGSNTESIDNLVTDENIREILNDEYIDNNLKSLIYDTWELHKQIKNAFLSGSIDEINKTSSNMELMTEKFKKLTFYIY